MKYFSCCCCCCWRGRRQGAREWAWQTGSEAQFSRLAFLVVVVVVVAFVAFVVLVVRPRGRHENLCRRPLGAIIYTCLIKIENNGLPSD